MMKYTYVYCIPCLVKEIDAIVELIFNLSNSMFVILDAEYNRHRTVHDLSREQQAAFLARKHHSFIWLFFLVRIVAL